MNGGGVLLFEIILFAAVAGFLLVRLLSVLGRRTGTEKRIDPFAPRAATPPQPSPFSTPGAAKGPVIEGRATPVTDAATTGRRPGAAAVEAVDRSFDAAAFLKGARGAFEIIVNAFAA
ncbi:MAG TPA: Tim44 domain-containing protein, partial [Stellaceae bacterium]|nr:Tim44 domain-containing protein [Stellaceae bacterium]